MNDPLGQNSTGQAFDPNAFPMFQRRAFTEWLPTFGVS